MKPIRPNGYVLIALTLVTAFLLLGEFASWGDRPVKRNSDEKVMLIQSWKGADLFRSYCASCHGRGGKGDGPVAPALNAKVPDLTTIAQRHGGVFPEKWVTELIEGPKSVLAHGSREMPGACIAFGHRVKLEKCKKMRVLRESVICAQDAMNVN
jgi:hypothetical protein